MTSLYTPIRLLDLFCGAGGSAVGYYRAGFDVVGVDSSPQPFYPFEFIQADALSLDYDFLMSFDAIHASPPCQQYSQGSAVARKHGKTYPDLFIPTRRTLIAAGLPYIIENVQGSPARGIGLCGTMFGLGVKRHRIFESNIKLQLPATPCTCYDHSGEFVTVAGSSFGKAEGAAAMGITWPIDKYQLKEAIPPAYTEFLGHQLRNAIHLALSNGSDRVLRNAATPGLRNDAASMIRNGNANAGPFSCETLATGCSDEQRRVIVSEPRAIPVTRRCGACQKPLPQGTARRKYCDDLCRLHAFRAR